MEYIFQSSQVLSEKLPATLHKTIVFILFGLRGDGRKIRQCLLLVHQKLVGGSSGPEAFMSLELQAKDEEQKRIKNQIENENAQAQAASRVIILD